MDTNQHRSPRRPQRRPRTTQKQRRERDKVLYTEAKPFNRNRFILQLLTVVAIVVALLLGLSIFFKANAFIVSGCKKYDAHEIQMASGIQEGENLLGINSAKVSGRIMTKLPYVKTVRVQIKLPDTVLIEITEYDVSYAVEAKDSSWWLISGDGKVLEQINSAKALDYTQLLGLRLDGPVVGQPAKAEEPIPQETMPDGETVPPTVLGSERLSAALTVCQALEANGMMGKQIGSVDVTNMGNIALWYDERYEVLLGGTDKMNTKIMELKQMISERSEHERAVLDFSYSVHGDGCLILRRD